MDAIFAANISSNTSVKIVDQGLQTPDGIAYDWVTDTVYWTDMGTKKIGESILLQSTAIFMLFNFLTTSRDTSFKLLFTWV